MIKPRYIRLEASTLCQLRCVSCPRDVIEKKLGLGFLKFSDFKKIVDANPQICKIELSNYGEIFLNPDLLKILQLAYKKNIILQATNGVNLNTATDEVLEGLVKYQFYCLSCSIDGASQTSYAVYRRNGNFEKVIEHIKRINYYKDKYRSSLPFLNWKFVVFEHNVREIKVAQEMAKKLKMSFCVEPPWDNSFSPVRDKSMLGKEFSPEDVDAEAYSRKTGKIFNGEICFQLWAAPQINFDGRVLGCCVNCWSDYGNISRDGLVKSINSEKMNYARQMLRGEKESRPDIPCAACGCYAVRKRRAEWVKPEDLKELSKNNSRLLVMLERRFVPLLPREVLTWIKSFSRKA